MQLSVVLSLLVVAAPTALLASPMHQQQQQQQQQQPSQPTVIGMIKVEDHNKAKADTKKRHHYLDHGLSFVNRNRHNCSALEDECKNCNGDISCTEDPNCEWCWECAWDPEPDVSYCNSTMPRV